MDREQKKKDERQQKILAEVLNRSDNQKCADCAMRGPKWASVSIGCFLCIRCAGLHRKMGTHISKVKSTNLDTWTPEWLDFVSSMGNDKVNELYLSRGNAPAVNNQNDGDMETFIRNKYEKKLYSLQSTAGANLYAAQLHQLLFMGFNDQQLNNEALNKNSGNVERAIEYIVSKQSQSQSQNQSQNQNQSQKYQQEATRKQEPVQQMNNQYASQLQQLKSMGFTNQQVNVEALNRHKGNLEQAIEYIVSRPQQSPASPNFPQVSTQAQQVQPAQTQNKQQPQKQQQPQNDLLDIFSSPSPVQQQFPSTLNAFQPQQVNQGQFNQLNQFQQPFQQQMFTSNANQAAQQPFQQQQFNATAQQQNPFGQQFNASQNQQSQAFQQQNKPAQQQQQLFNLNSAQALPQALPQAFQQQQLFNAQPAQQQFQQQPFQKAQQPAQHAFQQPAQQAFQQLQQPTQQQPVNPFAAFEQPQKQAASANPFFQNQAQPSFQQPTLPAQNQSNQLFNTNQSAQQNQLSFANQQSQQHNQEQLFREQNAEFQGKKQAEQQKESILSMFKASNTSQPQMGFNNYQIGHQQQPQQQYGQQFGQQQFGYQDVLMINQMSAPRVMNPMPTISNTQDLQGDIFKNKPQQNHFHQQQNQNQKSDPFADLNMFR